jgi:Fur family peroxide stress response transcriptional regulator
MDILRKHSKKRDAILEVIRSTVSHPGARWVYDRLKPAIPDLSLGTVYRNLTFFRQEGLVLSLGVVNGEERFDGNVAPHPHLVCRRCGRVADLPCPENETFTGLLAPGNMFPGGGSGRFRVDFRRTVFYGLCGDCAERFPLENPEDLNQIFI